MAVRLLDAVPSTGVSSDWPTRMGVLEHTIQGMLTGSPSSVVIDLDGSLDGDTYYQLASHTVTAQELATDSFMFHVTSKLVRYVRLNLVTLSGGTSPTVTAIYDGYNS